MASNGNPTTRKLQVNGLPSVIRIGLYLPLPLPPGLATHATVLGKLRPAPFTHMWAFYHKRNNTTEDTTTTKAGHRKPILSGAMIQNLVYAPDQSMGHQCSEETAIEAKVQFRAQAEAETKAQALEFAKTKVGMEQEAKIFEEIKASIKTEEAEVYQTAIKHIE
ncbi:MAG: hypothetical protein Q9218_001631 [Villophora microphyllina]